MKQMRFDVKEARDFLSKHNAVVTVRGYDMDDAEVAIDGIGVCFRKRICEIKKKHELDSLTEYSGFDSTDGWWYWIDRFCKNKRKFVYVIRKKGKEYIGELSY